MSSTSRSDSSVVSVRLTLASWMNSLILSNTELTMIVCALLEPRENPEIRKACLLLALKLQPYLTVLSCSPETLTAHQGLKLEVVGPFSSGCPGEP